MTENGQRDGGKEGRSGVRTDALYGRGFGVELGVGRHCEDIYGI